MAVGLRDGRLGRVMRELVRTTDVVFVSAVEALLSEAGIPSQVFDRDIRAIEGSINAFPMRVVVSDDRYEEALLVLDESGLMTR